MRRSELNQVLREAEDFIARHGFALPAWAHWQPGEWHERPEIAAYCGRRQMGWDVTDFGLGHFASSGLVLFCLRNGIEGGPGERTYAEKLLMVCEAQETPAHFHRAKMEDIIVRGGGNLMVELVPVDASGRPSGEEAAAWCDGERRVCPPGSALRLRPGESITLPQGLAHRFYGEPGHGPVLVGEVSQVNDDHTDNYFLAPVGRFSAIEEDEAPYRLLWNELPIR
jgi:hypothetical protein